MGSPAREDADLRALAARTVTDSLRAAVARAGAGAGDRAARFEECIRCLEAEKAKMEVFRRELPISVHLVADVIEWLKGELEQHRRPAAAPEMFALAPGPAQALAGKRKAEEKATGAAKADADANDKRSWMSSAQLWSCGSHSSTSNGNGAAAGGGSKKPAHKVSSAFIPLSGSPAFANSPEKTTVPRVPDLSLSSPAMDGPCPANAPAAAPSATSSAITDAGAHPPQQQQPAQRKARRCWSPELHRRFVAALQRLGGPQAATPKQIRELMKVDGLTNDEVKSHLQKYRLHTRRASDGSEQQAAAAAAAGPWPPAEQYTASQHSTSQSGSPQGPLQLARSSRGGGEGGGTVSVTAGDSCDGGGGEDEDEDGRSESYSWEMQNGATASPSA